MVRLPLSRLDEAQELKLRHAVGEPRSEHGQFRKSTDKTERQSKKKVRRSKKDEQQTIVITLRNDGTSHQRKKKK